MSFVDPQLLIAGLLALAGAAALYAFAARRRGSGREPFASPELSAAVSPAGPGRLRHLPPALYALAAVALVIALAKPQRTVAVPVEQATIMLVTDRSRSMSATDIPPSRLVAARSAASTFLGEVPPRVKVGAVAFNHRARLVQVPTTDRDAVRTALSGLTPEGGTATGEGLFLALASVRRPTLPGSKPPPAAIVLLADGKSSNGRDVLAVARQAAEAKVPVHTVVLGTRSGALPGGGTVTTDTETLRKVAELTGGELRTADDADELDAVYEELGSRLSTRDERRQVTAAFAGGGLLLLLAGAGASLFARGRLP